MPSVATGVSLASKDLLLIGVSGDGDPGINWSRSILPPCQTQCPHDLHRGEQQRLRSDKRTILRHRRPGPKLKTGALLIELPPIDLCGLAIELGCGFVGRSFAGDPKELVASLKAARPHTRRTAVLGVVSPCVTFNNHEGSTKSDSTHNKMETSLPELAYLPFSEQITN